jgi:hypothetical protein
VQNTLQIGELDGLFSALRDHPEIPLPQALREVVALAKGKAIRATDLQKILADLGIEGTPKFNAWLESQFTQAGA